MKQLTILMAFAILSLSLVACGDSGKSAETETTEAKKIDPMQDKGVGPVTSVTLGALDAKMATEGETLFEGKCAACHKLNKRYIGPAITGVTTRRSPEWIMNMILDPDRMVKENAAAKKLLMEYSSPMANQSLKETEARSILEYFRKLDSKK